MRSSWCVQGLIALVWLLLMAACAGSTRGRLIEQIVNPTLSEREVRAQVNAHLLRYSGMVEYTSFQIMKDTEDPAIRMAVLYWQINGITACRGAAFLDDPLVAALDCYVLGLQELALYRSEKGLEMFGDSRDLIVERLEDVHGRIQSWIIAEAKKPEEIRARLEAFAAEHPLSNLSYARDSISTEMAKLVGDPDLSVFAAVGTLDERMQDMAERLNVYAQQIPKQLLWSTALFKEQISQNEELQTLAQDVHSMNASLERLSKLDERLPVIIQDQVDQGMEGFSAQIEPVMQAIDTEREAAFAAVTTEREATLAEVDRQRLDTLAFVEVERKAMQATLDAKIVEVAALVESERQDIETLMDNKRLQITADVERITTASLQQAGEVAENRIHQLAWSLLAVGSALIFLVFLLRFLSTRFAATS